MENFKIVVTGGPHSGKDTLMKDIAIFLGEETQTEIHIVQEQASILRQKHPEWEQRDHSGFQRQLLSNQLELEFEHRSHATLFNRAIPDIKSYTSPSAWQDFKSEFPIDKPSEIFARYDLVFFLESYVDKDIASFQETNPMRLETSASSILASQSRTWSAWRGHNNIHRIGNDHGIEGKLADIKRISANQLSLSAGSDMDFE